MCHDSWEDQENSVFLKLNRCKSSDQVVEWNADLYCFKFHIRSAIAVFSLVTHLCTRSWSARVATNTWQEHLAGRLTQGLIHRKGVKRLAHHFTSAMPGWSDGISWCQSPPDSPACRYQALVRVTVLNVYIPFAEIMIFSWKTIETLLLQLCSHHLSSWYSWSPSGGPACMYVFILLLMNHGTGWGRTNRKMCTSSNSSAFAQSRLSLCFLGSNPPVGSTYIILFGPWQYSLSSVTCPVQKLAVSNRLYFCCMIYVVVCHVIHNPEKLWLKSSNEFAFSAAHSQFELFSQ